MGAQTEEQAVNFTTGAKGGIKNQIYINVHASLLEGKEEETTPAAGV